MSIHILLQTVWIALSKHKIYFTTTLHARYLIRNLYKDSTIAINNMKIGRDKKYCHLLEIFKISFTVLLSMHHLNKGASFYYM